MWPNRFQQHLLDNLAASGHPEVAKVDLWSGPDPDQQNISIACTDGRTYFLAAVHTSRPGGEDHLKPEVIVTKDDPAPQ